MKDRREGQEEEVGGGKGKTGWKGNGRKMRGMGGEGKGRWE